MGMFDNVIISPKLLPVSDEEKKKIGENPVWQTKSLDNEFAEIIITDDGYLRKIDVRLIYVPKKDRPYGHENGWRSLIGCIREQDRKLINLPYTGILNFYSDIGKERYEFIAIFEKGKLKEITKGKQDGIRKNRRF